MKLSLCYRDYAAVILFQAMQELNEIGAFLQQRDASLAHSYDQESQNLCLHALSKARLGHALTVFLPGTMGSDLKTTDNSDQAKSAWLSFNLLRHADEVTKRIEIQPDDDPGLKGYPDSHWRSWMWTKPKNAPSLVARAIVDLKLDLVFFEWHITAPYERIEQGILPFAYDWREDIRISAARFALFMQRLDRGMQLFDSVLMNKRITVVGHSMGCSVILYALGRYSELFDDLEKRGRINKILMVAPPFRGAVGPLHLIQTGVTESGLDHLVSSVDVVREMAGSTPGAFQLICAPENVWRYGLTLVDQRLRAANAVTGDVTAHLPYPMRVVDGSTGVTHTVSNWSEFPLGFAQSVQMKWLQHGCSIFHQEMNQFISVRMTKGDFPCMERLSVWIGMDGRTQVSVVHYEEKNETVFLDTGPVSTSDPRKIWNGDGCVLVQSAVLPPSIAQYAILLSDSSKHTRYHRDIFTQDHVIVALRRYVRGGDPVIKATSYLKGGAPQGPAVLPLDQALLFVDWSHEDHQPMWYNTPEARKGFSGRLRDL